MTVRDRDSVGRTRSAKRKSCTFVLAAILAVLVSGPSGSFLAAPIASAHTDLESSTPAEGDVVNDIVDEIELVAGVLRDALDLILAIHGSAEDVVD